MAPAAVVFASGIVAGVVPTTGAPGSDRGVTPDEVRAIVAQVLADAETRSSLESASDMVELDDQLTIVDPSTGLRISMTGQMQTRYMATIGADGGTDGSGSDSDFESGFQLRNMRLDFRGKLPGDRLSFRFMPAYFANDGTMRVLNAYTQIRLEKFEVRLGQFVDPFTREFNVGAMDQLCTDRSLVDTVFRMSRVQGVGVWRRWDRIRSTMVISDGSHSLNTDYTDPAEANIALTGRVEARLLDAEWEEFDTLFSSKADVPGIMLGAAANWQQGGTTGAPSTFSDDSSLTAFTADVSCKGPGWTAMVSGVGRVIEDHGSSESVADFGFVAQGGLLVSDHVELFSRYTQMWPSNERPGGTATVSTIEAGASWYLVPGSNVFKLTAQVLWMPEPQEDSDSIVSAPNTLLGILPDDSGGQAVVVVQIQVIF